jgi:hypothetical protein
MKSLILILVLAISSFAELCKVSVEFKLTNLQKYDGSATFESASCEPNEMTDEHGIGVNFACINENEMILKYFDNLALDMNTSNLPSNAFQICVSLYGSESYFYKDNKIIKLSHGIYTLQSIRIDTIKKSPDVTVEYSLGPNCTLYGATEKQQSQYVKLIKRAEELTNKNNTGKKYEYSEQKCKDLNENLLKVSIYGQSEKTIDFILRALETKINEKELSNKN